MPGCPNYVAAAGVMINQTRTRNQISQIINNVLWSVGIHGTFSEVEMLTHIVRWQMNTQRQEQISGPDQGFFFFLKRENISPNST